MNFNIRKVLNSTCRGKQQTIPNGTAQAPSIKASMCKIWLTRHLKPMQVFHLMALCPGHRLHFGVIAAHVHLEVRKNSLLFLPLNKRPPHRIIYICRHTHKSTLLSPLYPLSLHALPPLMCWAVYTLYPPIFLLPLFSPVHSLITTNPLKLLLYQWALLNLMINSHTSKMIQK